MSKVEATTWNLGGATLKPGLSYDSIQGVLEGIDGPYRR